MARANGITALLCSLLMLHIFSCNKQDEELPKIISITNVGEPPSHNLMAQAGSQMAVQVEVADNKGLKQIKLELKTSTTLHQHSDQVTAFQQLNIGQWDTLIVLNTSGQQAMHIFRFDVPQHIIGGWRLLASVLDVDGNIYTGEKYVHVMNSLLPFFNVTGTTPNVGADGVLKIFPGDALQVSGQVIDLDTLASVGAQITRSSTIVWQQEWNSLDSWSFDLSQIAWPELTNSGNYLLRLTAQDLTGRSNAVSANILVQ